MIKKAVRSILENDATLMNYVNQVFTFFNTRNVRRVNPAILKTMFPMITVNELSKEFNDPHQEPTNHCFTSTLEVQLDTIIDTDACNEKQLENMDTLLDAHEDAATRIFDLLHLYEGTLEGVKIPLMLFESSSDSQQIYNLVNNDKDQVVYRKTLIFNLNYIEGV